MIESSNLFRLFLIVIQELHWLENKDTLRIKRKAMKHLTLEKPLRKKLDADQYINGNFCISSCGIEMESTTY